jgi:methionyl-tRNA formyltransferase
MKISILTNKDLASCLVLNRLVPALSDHELSINLSAKDGSQKRLPQQLRELKFFEQDLFNEIVFPALAATAPARTPELLSFDGIARLTEQPIAELNNINTAEDLKCFARSEPDLVVSIRFGTILREAVISLPRYGVLNLHSGLLPAYKGVMATFRAMLNEEQKTGTTLHFIDDSSIDCGRIIGRTVLPVDPTKSYLWHVLELYEQGCALLLSTIATIDAEGSVACESQDSNGCYYSFPTQTELARFAESGLKLVEPDEIVRIAQRFM